MIFPKEVLYDLNVLWLHQLGRVELELVLVFFESLPKSILFYEGLLPESSKQVCFLELLLYQGTFVGWLTNFPFLLELSLFLLSSLFLDCLCELFYETWGSCYIPRGVYVLIRLFLNRRYIHNLKWFARVIVLIMVKFLLLVDTEPLGQNLINRLTAHFKIISFDERVCL